jgi:hypothetical protein
MKALKVIGSFLGLLVSFALIVGIGAAVVAFGFIFSWFLIGLFVVAGCIFATIDYFKSR